MKRIVFVTVSLFLLLNSCKKKTEEPQVKVEDQLSDSQLLVLDNAPLDTTTKFSDVLFSDGRNIAQWGAINDSGFTGVFSRHVSIFSASDKKDAFIKRMTDAGIKLTDDSQCSCSATQPNGLAYVYGSKHINFTYLDRISICQQRYYGLDCSGMIYQMAINSKLNLIESGTVKYIEPGVWNDAFNSSSDFQGLQMRDTGILAATQLEPGDIIVAANEHIGMVYRTATGLGILNSQGSWKNTCNENSLPGRGPVKRFNVQGWLRDLFPNNNYRVLRVVLNGAPGVTTNMVSSISQAAAISGGNVTNEGGSIVTSKGVCWNTSPDPTILNSKTSDGSGRGQFNSSLTGLVPNTTYYVRAYATNSSGTSYGTQVSFKTPPLVMDVDGNSYTTVVIGTQTWFVENLKTTKFRNGDPISNITDASQWAVLTTGSYCNYNNDVSNANIYGRLYNWYAVNDSRGITPNGWHIATSAEWQQLISFLGGSSVAGGKLKSLNFWSAPNTGATNSSGFTGLPGGNRGASIGPSGVIYDYRSIGNEAIFWSATSSSPGNADFFNLSYSLSSIGASSALLNVGNSVRCIKD